MNDFTPEALELMRKYSDQLIELMRDYAGKGLEYVEIERATMQALLGLNWEYNLEAQIDLERWKRSWKGSTK